MKKRLCIILLLTALLVLLAGCGEKISLDIQDTAAIELRSGNTGDSGTITGPKIIAQITDNVTSLRCRIPVLVRIHSSLVSTIFARSSLVTICSGT